jgi:hypothetical protein
MPIPTPRWMIPKTIRRDARIIAAMLGDVAI